MTSVPSTGTGARSAREKVAQGVSPGNVVQNKPSRHSGRKLKPLASIRVLITRAKKQAAGLSKDLRSLGATVIEIPAIEIRPPRSYKPLDSALRNATNYDWLILTSVNGVEALISRLKKLRMEPADLDHLKIAAIGPATHAAIEKQGLYVEVVPDEYVAEGVLRSLDGRTEGKRVLLVRARIARDVLPNELRRAGTQVDVVEAYETVVPKSSRDRLRQVLRDPRRRPDVITFTSSSTARNFVSLMGGRNPARQLRGIALASIGPVTSSTLKELGLEPAVEASPYTMAGLVQAIIAATQGRSMG